MDSELLFFLPTLIFAIITGYCYVKMVRIATPKKKYYNGKLLFGYKAMESDFKVFDDFRTITHQLADKEKKKMYNRIYYGFVVGLILTPVSMGGLGLVMIFLESLNHISTSP